MHRRRVGPWALTLALSVSVAGSAGAQVPTGGSQGGVFTRYFKRSSSSSPRVEKEDVITASATTPALAAGARQAQALADWVRRSEVCLKLRDIAHETGDDDLWRKADQLEQRAYDAYVQQAGRSTSVDEAALQRRLAPAEPTDVQSRLLRSMGLGRKTPPDAGQAALGEGR
jgi:hypothetical protein